ncbi:MAG: Type 1 glutamine amidotransferase-like domain-containing protein [Micrococcales bacterium]|nr:Type 1 glutamine amidotransferase-like domain-containing protein [Micrococcales bacterium]
MHLVGGGWSPEAAADVYGPFLAEAAARAAGSGRRVPRIGVLLHGTDAEARQAHERSPAALARAGAAEPVVARAGDGDTFPSSALSDVDGLLVGGGPTPEYHRALEPLYDEIRLLVADGLPYLGFSAGSMIAAERAIIGGWRIDGIPVAPEETAEDLDEVRIVEGLGLVDLAIDVHAAQWGTLSRLVAAVEAGLVPGGVAIDEDTALIVGQDLRVAGAGNVWQVVEGPDGVMVGTLAA